MCICIAVLKIALMSCRQDIIIPNYIFADLVNQMQFNVHPRYTAVLMRRHPVEAFFTQSAIVQLGVKIVQLGVKIVQLGAGVKSCPRPKDAALTREVHISGVGAGEEASKRLWR